MFVKNINITGINGIRSLSIPLHRRMNLICGPNGIGKSTVLESIAATFSHGHQIEIKRFRNTETGKIEVGVGGKHAGNYTVDVSTFKPGSTVVAGSHQLSDYIFSLKTARVFSYSPLAAISRDPEVKGTGRSYQVAQSGIPIADAKNWFANRYLYSAHANSLTSAQMKNFEFAKKCFSLLNPEFSFHSVDASSNEIMVKTPAGEIYYEYLSSGFKSCLSIMWGVIKEIEYRFPDTAIGEVEGIALIDEIELHLHPEWQARIIVVLMEFFPEMQFVISTHSPHVIQNADSDTVIALGSNEGDVFHRDLAIYSGSFKGWTIEEILEDVMGMPDTRTTFFNELASTFGLAIDDEDVDLALLTYHRLDALLHPKNAFRKIARLQLASIGVSLD